MQDIIIGDLVHLTSNENVIGYVYHIVYAYTNNAYHIKWFNGYEETNSYYKIWGYLSNMIKKI